MTDQPKPKPKCPSCGAEQAEWLLCDKCTRQLRWALRSVISRPGETVQMPRQRVLVCAGHACVIVELPSEKGQTGRRQTLPWEDQTGDWTGIDDQLTVSLARLGRIGSRNGSRSSENPLPFDPGSSGAIGDLRNCLAGWVRVLFIEGEDVWPADTLPGMAQWLLTLTRRIRAHEAAAEIKHDVVRYVSRALSMIDAPQQRQLVGKCPVCGKGDVYSRPDAEVGVCRLCDAVVGDVQGARSSLLAKAEDRLVTREEILKALPGMYGLTISATRLRKWVHRRQLETVACSIEVDRWGQDQYLIADVLDLAHATVVRQTTEVGA